LRAATDEDAVHRHRRAPVHHLRRDTSKGHLADQELQHRRQARCEDRIRNIKATGLRNLPLKGLAQNQVWCEIVALACELLAWMQMLALTGTAAAGSPSGSGCGCSPSPTASGRHLRIRLARHWPWAGQITTGTASLQTLLSGLPARTTTTTEREHTRPVEPCPPRRDSREVRYGRNPKSVPAQRLTSPHHGRARSRLVIVRDRRLNGGLLDFGRWSRPNLANSYRHFLRACDDVIVSPHIGMGHEDLLVEHEKVKAV
jgi:hypothetical protein